MTSKTYKLVVSFLALAISAGLVTSASAAPVEAPQKYLIVLPSNAKAHAGDVVAAGGRVLQTLNNIDTLIVSIPARAAERLAAARPDWVVGPDLPVSLATTETQSPTKSWGQDRVDQVSLPLNSTYSYPAAEKGAGVTAYVLDTGIRRDHIEFSGRVRQGYQGYTDTSGTGDCQGHGTHVAGTIGGSTVGMAKLVDLVAVTILGCTGSGSTTVIAAGADWVVADHVSGPAVANMSLGGGANSTLDAVVTKMVRDGITVVVAAGNSNADACNYSPARAASAITVGSTTSSDARSSFSNFGTCVDIFAPGSSIYSSYYSGSTSYATLSGTSMASPAVAGIAARYLSAFPNATPDEVWGALNTSSTLGLVTSPGTGSPNKLLFAPSAGFNTTPSEPTAPAQVSGVTTSGASTSSFNVNWNAPATGGSAITGYDVQVSQDSTFASGVTTLNLVVVTSTAVTGLSADTLYYVRVAAKNTVGTGAWSSNVTGRTQAVVTEPVVPNAPLSFTAATRNKTSISLSWTSPGGTITGYVVEVSTSNTFGTILQRLNYLPTATSAVVSGLRSRTQYHFRIAAVNSTARSTWATATALTAR